ncbi:MAG: hypothetical protein CL866_09005 [Cycloclasticus sp.]|nr:hypothetical protein [Cycloclasticus sp.]MBG96981.1 hypothetical protein [Cycloclasticus sp.]|tara:strand:- start:1192 stop:1650 length:459 start_codon:yes stop_codon:yes gene_type:complete
MTKRKTVIVDLDGTIALNEHRHHYIYPKNGSKPDWNSFFLACIDDTPNMAVIHSIEAFKKSGYKIHIMSARGMIAHKETVDWLSKFSITYDELTMRNIGCYKPDEELKQYWIEKLYPNYQEDILCVFDDRDKVVNMWRSLGLTCFQVAEGDF